MSHKKQVYFYGNVPLDSQTQALLDAAPDLLAACKGLIALQDTYTVYDSSEQRDRAKSMYSPWAGQMRAAVAKAEGRDKP